jgi:hypothetical protein
VSRTVRVTEFRLDGEPVLWSASVAEDRNDGLEPSEADVLAMIQGPVRELVMQWVDGLSAERVVHEQVDRTRDYLHSGDGGIGEIAPTGDEGPGGGWLRYRRDRPGMSDS